MPHLLVRGIKAEQMAAISEPLTEELAAICQCGTDNFTIECLHTTGVFAGKIVDSFPFIQVSWFERGQEVRDKFAETVTRHVLSLGVPEVEVAFTSFEKESYYANGKHF
ncbi:DUF1904 family protein [Brevibacillus sp. TJ4]|uniref:DUF1904 family protein n=1 Tax=Brevibacillus sp. TJ4 TaxID=3234853 RepID=UPI003BA2C9FC